ncbi:hypothetical protein HZA86_03065 [Candidatus Uhrbacteria bacterium]|nr:hypothetical protein [Candidatus Uhrbacteria bacterium]
MRILAAVGLGLTIIVLKSLTPTIWVGFERTLLQFFELLQVVMTHLETVVGRGSPGF